MIAPLLVLFIGAGSLTALSHFTHAAAAAPRTALPPATAQSPAQLQSAEPATPPRLVQGSISNEDYPVGAIRVGGQGTTAVKLTIDAEGRVARCEVGASSGFDILDVTTCSLMAQRFRYAPARDAQGRAVRSHLSQRVAWRLPEDEPPPLAIFAAGQMLVALTMGEEEPFRCAAEARGATFVEVAAASCPVDRRVELAELMSDRNAVLTVTSFSPDGTPRPDRPVVRGTLIGSLSADIEIGNDGRIVACEVHEVPTSVPVDASTAHPCNWLASPHPAFDGASSPSRRGFIRIDSFRLGVPEI